MAQMSVRLISAALLVTAPLQAAAGPPFRDAIPKAFWGTYARSAPACADSRELAYLKVTADQLAYYEADEFLLLGISFEGSMGSSRDVVPMLNGRFTARQETDLLGEVNLRLVLEKPNVLVRYRLGDDGQPDEAHPDRWIRCPEGKR
jgi:hypothetical protein